MTERDAYKGPVMNRRGFGRVVRTTAEYAAGSYLLTLTGMEVLKALPLHSEVRFSPRQQVHLLQESMNASGNRKAILTCGGLTVADPVEISTALTPALEKLDVGAIGDVVYAQNGTDPKSTVQQMRLMQDRFGIDTFSFNGHSIGLHMVGEIITASEGVLRPWKLNTAIGDCLPPKAGSGYSPGIEKFLSYHWPVSNDPLLTLGITAQSYDGNAFYPGTALPPLFGSQIYASRDGSNLEVVAKKLKEDGGTFHWLTPKDPTKDRIVNAIASEPQLREIFGSNMQKHEIEGPFPGHANPQKNKVGYEAALAQIKPIER